jgi:hypothetical protein
VRVELIAPLPATPSAASPAVVPQGVAAVTVTITGTAVSGSGFYDTPSSLTDACRQRLVAAVTGGVTVNSVTYISPTLVQMNLSTVGAPAGLKNVTLTNPDGQSVTGNGLIQVASAVTYTLSTGTAGNGSGTIALNPPGGVYNSVRSSDGYPRCQFNFRRLERRFERQRQSQHHDDHRQQVHHGHVHWVLPSLPAAHHQE